MARQPVTGAFAFIGGPKAALEIDLSGLNTAIRRRLDEIGGRTDRELHRVGLAFVKRARSRAPVRTGRYMWSIHRVLPGETDVYMYRDNHGRLFDGSLDITAGKTEVVIGTNVPYAIFVEGGNSTQAPLGVFEVTALEMEREFMAELEQVARGR